MASAKLLLSCLLPTFNRRHFVPRAIEYFLRQDYEPKELIIVDDGEDGIGELVPADERIRYIRLNEKLTVGAKRNLACEQAQGEIIAHWDDDDWHAPHRLSYQVEALLHANADVCGINRLLFYDIIHGRAWQYTYPSNQRFWLSGSSLCYTKAFWAGHRFPEINVGEDARFVWSGRPEQMIALPDHTFHIGIIHDRNVSAKNTRGAYWQLYPVEEIQKRIGLDWNFYLPAAARDAPQRESIGIVMQERNIGMMTAARQSDLELPEFAAFNHDQTLPWMRRWELPFGLFQARLSNTMAVLDCTINPAGFQERLSRLYPDVLYRHWSPIQGGKFEPPLGVPDESFDRVICVNTLEHLLQSQRKSLLQSISRKLKAGGLLILTSDYYFDSFWEQSAFLQAGMMRADRQEIFNGWNRVTPREWLDLCSQYDLHPMAECLEEPQEHDPGLYRQQPPYPHACIAGVFYKSPRQAFPDGKKIVLALLAWNTCQVTHESIKAYIREAQMLRRLGQTPVICVCDNGSTDGTSQAMHALEREIDVPYHFIFNAQNKGNSIARNQIIDFMLACEADYVLFMDGDIEIVPFSSFAMLRHIENMGHRLGCIGADSAGQTPQRVRASRYFYGVDPARTQMTNLVAWTQYGMFRRGVFEDGVRFDDSEPFDRAGWGFEDNDLAFQMETKGYQNQRFFGMTYLHRDARSSIRVMRQLGIDANSLYEKRKQYVINKWSSVPLINNGPLMDVRRVTMRL